jgi:hypothetical protein
MVKRRVQLNNDRIPVAWLPAMTAESNFHKQVEAILTRANELGVEYTLKYWEPISQNLEVVASVEVSPSDSRQGEASIGLSVSKSRQSIVDAEALSGLNYKRNLETSTTWTRVMRGKPSAKVLANHTLAGVVFGFQVSNSAAFSLTAKNLVDQKSLDLLLKVQQVRFVVNYPGVWRPKH